MNMLREKYYILDLLAATGITSIESQVVARLPSLEQFGALYGTSSPSDPPVVVGMETCHDFLQQAHHGSNNNRAAAAAVQQQEQPFYVGVAGMFNSGTTSMEMYLRENLVLGSFPNQLDYDKGVPWGKHRLWSIRHDYMAADHVDKMDRVFPIVIIRDPFSWMASMCTSPYKAKWPHAPIHCPNLVANADDVALSTTNEEEENEKVTTTTPGRAIPVVLTAQRQRSFASLLDLWIQWYGEYLDSHAPRLMVRFEDVLIRPDAVVDQIRQCLQLVPRQQQDFVYAVGALKWDQKYVKKQSSLVSAIIKYGNGLDRLRNLTAADLELAKQELSAGLGGRLVSEFKYSIDQLG